MAVAVAADKVAAFDAEDKAHQAYLRMHGVRYVLGAVNIAEGRGAAQDAMTKNPPSCPFAAV
ncbi:hypothetical protein PS874_06294 [Pseudomonas fluorescens]|nr:hypothetical protein PS874_06294 [Pseudomonas fluorescens]